MEQLTGQLKVGYKSETGEQVDIPFFHTFTAGITRHGKTETLKALASRSDDYKVLIFDVKTPPDYQDIGTEIPIHLEKHTDPTTIKKLLEAESEISLSYQFSEIIKMYEPNDTYQDLYDRMEEYMDEDIHPVEEDKVRVLHHLLGQLVDDLNAADIREDLILENGINVMPLHNVSRSVQQLAISSTVRKVLDDEDQQDVIIILDEASRFIPQGSGTPAKQEVVRTIKEGAASNIWLWLSDQTITGTEKDNLKQIGNWILGRQTEKNEAKRTIDQIPFDVDVSYNDIMTLKKGHFVVGTEEDAIVTYVQPSWVDDETAQSIAESGDISMAEESKPETEQSEEFENLEDELHEKDKTIRDLREKISDRDDKIDELQEEIDKMNQVLEQEESGQSEPVEAESAVDEEEVREIVREALDEEIERIEVPEGIDVATEKPRLRVKEEVKKLELDKDSLEGKIALLYVKGELPEEDYWSTGDFYDLFNKYGWSQNPQTKQKLDEFCQWGFLEKRMAGTRSEYRVAMPPEEAKDKGLLEKEEIVS